jgi:non-specific serine/threonine protein kinase
VAELASYGAVQLFVERAQAAAPAFRLLPENGGAVAEVCRRLDGIPLALELAAARLQVLDVEQILARLADSIRLLTGGSRAGPSRQQTLRATLDWSYDLLTGPEQVAFRRLAAFPGGFELGAAEAVVGAAAADEPVLEVLARLVGKSLVVAEAGSSGAGRYRLLEPVRQYAHERLEAGGEAAAARQRHAVHYLALAEAAEPRLPESAGPDSPASLARLEPEHENIRQALRWFVASGAVEQGLRLGGALRHFWLARGLVTEGRAHLRALLALPGAPPEPGEGGGAPAAARAKALSAAAMLTYRQGDSAAAGALGEAALALRRALGDRPGTAVALHYLGIYTREQGAPAAAAERLEEALALYRELGDQRSAASALDCLGTVAHAAGDYAHARSRYEAGLRLAREAGNLGIMAWAPYNLGLLALDQDDRAGARAWLEQSAAAWQALSDRPWIVHAAAAFAVLATAEGHPAHALRLAGAAHALGAAMGVALPPTNRSRVERSLAAARRALGAPAAAAAWEEGQAMSAEQAAASALAAWGAAEPRGGRTPAPPAPGAAEVLTPREREVVGLIAAGCRTDRQLAARLGITPGTAGVHVERILSKLGLHSRWLLAGPVAGAGDGGLPEP